MCSLAPVPCDNIGLYWSDEELIMSLERMTKGSPVPENVIADVNPYQHKPSHLPDGIWYFIRSEQIRDSEHGFWKARGEASEIYRNSAIIGWRTTLEFYEGRAPHGQRTKWVMQEYTITQKGQLSNSNPRVNYTTCYRYMLFSDIVLLFSSSIRPASQLPVWLGNMQESSLLCRIFLSSGATPNQNMQQKLGGSEIAGGNHFQPKASVVPDTGSTTGQGCMSKSKASNKNDNTGPLGAAGALLNIPVKNMADFDYISRGDYLELDDLEDQGSQPSSSNNTSCRSLTSDECFDSLALLRDLECEIDQDEEKKDTNFKFSVAASVRPNEVVMHPATLGSLTSRHERKSPVEAIDKKLLDKRVPEKAGNANEGTFNFHNMATSSRSHGAAVPECGKKAFGGRMKRLKDLCCFMPF